VARWSVASGSRRRAGGRLEARYVDGQTADTGHHVRLGAEQLRPLELLASSRHGANEALLVLSHGFSRRMLAGLVRRASLQQHTVR